MRCLVAILSLMLLAVAARDASAQECQSLVGSRVETISFDAAVTALSQVPSARDEFETTAQYQARLAIAMSSVPSRLLISVPLDTRHVTYNADAGRFDIQSYAIRNTNTDYFTVFYGSPFYGSVPFSTLGNIDIVVGSSDEERGTYQGQNAYGATWTVTRVTRTVRAIFDREPRRYTEELFGDRATRGDGPVRWSIPVAPELARGLRERLRAAVVVAPKAPFYFENTQQGVGRVTIQNPRDVDQLSRIIVADIQCALITDDVGNVLVAQPTA
jgi:hypothetical protein